MAILRSLIAFVLPTLIGILLLLLLSPLGRRRAVNLARPLITPLGLWLAGIQIQVHGEHTALHRRPAVFVINHQSGTDPIIIAHLLKRNVCGIAKVELARHPMLGPLLRLGGTTFVQRNQGQGVKSVSPALARLRENMGVVIAAEGHRSPHGKLLPFRPGAIWLARQARAPIIPLVIHDSHRILPPGALRMTPGQVHVTVLPPMDAREITPSQLQAVFANTLRGDQNKEETPQQAKL